MPQLIVVHHRPGYTPRHLARLSLRSCLHRISLGGENHGISNPDPYSTENRNPTRQPDLVLRVVLHGREARDTRCARERAGGTLPCACSMGIISPYDDDLSLALTHVCTYVHQHHQDVNVWRQQSTSTGGSRHLPDHGLPVLTGLSLKACFGG